MTRLACLVMLLAACVPALPGTVTPMPPDVASALDVLLEQWRAADLPLSSGCERRVRGYSVAAFGDAQMRRFRGRCATGSQLCGTPACEPYCIAGSVSLDTSTVIVSEYGSADQRRAWALHEFAHVLTGCNAVEHYSAHGDPRIWHGVTGVVVRTQALTGGVY